MGWNKFANQDAVTRCVRREQTNPKHTLDSEQIAIRRMVGTSAQSPVVTVLYKHGSKISKGCLFCFPVPVPRPPRVCLADVRSVYVVQFFAPT